MKRRRRVRSPQDLPVQALYPLALLARASGADRRTLKGVLDRAGVRCFQTSASVWVPLSEIELKVPRLWDSIRAAEMLRHLAEDE